MKMNLLGASLAIMLAWPAVQPGAAQFAPAQAGIENMQPIRIGGMLAGSAIWQDYQRRFVHQDGRVIDTGNGYASHSEGQGYGMLIAVAAADRPAFERIWSWTRKNLFVRKDGLAAWKWIGGAIGVADHNNATDGDLLVAWALAEAADLWEDPAYLSSARTIAGDIFGNAVRADARLGPVLMPAVNGFSERDRLDGPVVNLSYWIFPALLRMRQISPEHDWNRLAQTGLTLLETARFGPTQLPTDWISLASGQPAPASGFRKVFGYNSIRIPLYLYWSGAENSALMQSFATASQESMSGTPLERQSENTATGKLDEQGFRSVVALARCTAWGTPYPLDFYHIAEPQNYYPATLGILSLMAAASAESRCLDRNAMTGIAAAGWHPQAGTLPHATPEPSKAGIREVQLQAAIRDPGGMALARREAIAAGPGNFEDSFAILKILLAGLAPLFSFSIGYALHSLMPSNKRNILMQRAFANKAASDSTSRTVSVPRILPQNPFDDGSPAKMLEMQLENAAEACARLSRTIGIAYFEFASLVGNGSSQEVVAATNSMADLAKDMRNLLRSTDHVAVLDNCTIVACITLLSNATDLRNISARLQNVAIRSGHSTAMLVPGCAVYPIDGYGGAELIASAKSNFLAANPTNAASVPFIAAATPVAAKCRTGARQNSGGSKKRCPLRSPGATALMAKMPGAPA